MKDNIKKAASLLKIDPYVLQAIVAHAKEIDTQFEMMGVSTEDNIYATKIIIQDNDGNWYVSQDEPNDDSLWADARSDDSDMYDDGDEDEDDDDEDGGAEVIAPQPTVLV
jgi:hypothetical protein